MKRGLVVLDAPVTADELHSRVAALQRELRARGVKAALLYGDVYRSGDITYLCNLCIYWNEGLLLVPAEGDPALLTKLSARVQPWMRATSTLGQIRSGPDLAGLLAERMRDEAPEAMGEAEMTWWGPLGLVEMTWWPAPLVDRVAELLPGLELRDLGPVVRQARLRPSPAELEMLRAGGSITGKAMAAAAAPGLSPGERVAAAELAARGAGVEDAVIHCDPLPGGGSALQVTTEYRGYWTEAAVATDAAATDGEKYAAVQGALRAGVTPAELRRLGGQGVEVVHHVDIETGGDYPPSDGEAALPAGSVVAVRLGSRSDTYLLQDGGAECLTEASNA